MNFKDNANFSTKHKDERYKHMRADNFKDWNMYKAFLSDQGLLGFELDFKRTDWQAYLKNSR